MTPRESTEPQRWTLEGGVRKFPGGFEMYDTLLSGPVVFLGEKVEVMPVSEHERWREAFLEGQRADHARCDELREAAEAVVDEVQGWFPSVRRLREVLAGDGQKQGDSDA